MPTSPRFPVVAPSASVQYELLNFNEALEALLEGNRVSKTEWNDKEIWFEMRSARLHIHKHDGYHTLIVSEGDIIGQDYFIL